MPAGNDLRLGICLEGRAHQLVLADRIGQPDQSKAADQGSNYCEEAACSAAHQKMKTLVPTCTES
jgi:hypothetical protein